MTASRSRRRRLFRSVVSSRMAVAVLLAAHAFLLAYGATVHSPTRDEPTRLSRGLWILKSGRFDQNRGNPPLVEMTAALPIVLLFKHVDLPPTFYLLERNSPAQGPSIISLFVLSRWACIPYSLAGAYVCWRWAADLYGRAAGLASLSLWCFAPTQLAFGQLITCDATAAAFGLLAAYAFWKWLSAPGWSSAALAGLTLGLAGLSKMIWVILFVLWPVFWLGTRACGRLVSRRELVRQAAHVALMIGCAVVLVNAGYGFQGSLRPVSNYPTLSAIVLGGSPPQFVRKVPVPFPEDYLRGMEDIDDAVSVKQWSYLRGEWKEGGWPYYYLYAMLVKEPIGALCLLAVACWLSLRELRRRRFLRRDWLVVVMAAVVMAVVSSLENWNHHYRYVLPALPFAYVFMGKSARRMFGRPSLPAALAGSAWAASIAGSLVVYPHSLSHFNQLAGGPAGGRHHLVNSNLDWGQDLLYLRDWLDDHPEARPLNLAYFGAMDPHLVGIDYQLPPRAKSFSAGTLTQDARATGDVKLAPGWYAISVNFVMGSETEAPDGMRGLAHIPKDSLTYFQKFTPVARAGYSIDIYHIPAESAEADSGGEELSAYQPPNANQ